MFKDERHRLTRLKPQSVAKRALRQEVLVQILLMSLMKEKPWENGEHLQPWENA